VSNVTVEQIRRLRATNPPEHDRLMRQWINDRHIQWDFAYGLMDRIETLEAEHKNLNDIFLYLRDCGPEVRHALEESKPLSANYGEEQRKERNQLRQRVVHLETAIQDLLDWNNGGTRAEGTFRAAIERLNHALAEETERAQYALAPKPATTLSPEDTFDNVPAT